MIEPHSTLSNLRQLNQTTTCRTQRGNMHYPNIVEIAKALPDSDDLAERFYQMAVNSGLIAQACRVFPNYNTTQAEQTVEFVVTQLDRENLQNSDWAAARDMVWEKVLAGLI